ncbi:MAG: PspC domain-containing protein [Pseudomonadota bacterium]
MSQLDKRHLVTPANRDFRLDKANGKIAGVCAAIANYFNIDPLVVRLVFGVGAIAGFGTFIVLYLAIWLLAD